MRGFAFALLLSLAAAVPLTAVGATEGDVAAVTATGHKVVMYTTQSCGYCARARQYFTERGIRWREIDIEASDAAAAEFKAQGGIGTPLILVDQKRIAGFDPQRIELALQSR